MAEGLATLERGHVLLYRQGREKAARAAMRLEVPGPVSPLSTLPSPEEFPAMRSSGSREANSTAANWKKQNSASSKISTPPCLPANAPARPTDRCAATALMKGAMHGDAQFSPVRSKKWLKLSRNISPQSKKREC